MEEALKDERFSHILSDPRFRKMPKRIQRVMLDKRMKTIFKDSSFKGKCDLDKRGRQLNLTPTENLKKLYDMPSESSDDEEDEDEDEEENLETNLSDSEIKQKSDSKNEAKIKVGKKKKKKNASKVISQTIDSPEETKIKAGNKKGKNAVKVISQTTDSEESTSEESDVVDDLESDKNIEEKEAQTLKEKKRKLPKDDSDKSSSEESDDSDSESDDSSGNQSEDFDHKWEELRNEAPDTNEISRRLAVCNMDWDRIRAVDLLVCFNSFKPPDGCINSVKIYPSEFGLKRMEEERLKGPSELVEETLPLDEEELQDRKGSKYHREKLRQYQIRRLKYYYAVVDCDSPETADVLYEQLNGMEYESSSVRFDLRFIPDDVTFEHEPISSADKLPDPTDYKPRLFVTSALQQVKVDLTWDETEPKRREFFQKIFTDPDSVQNDIHEYLASASSESEVEDNTATEELSENMKTTDRIAKYRELLQSLEEKEKKDEDKYDMEVTWEPSVKEKAEEQVREKIKKDTLNPFEEMLHKKKEKRKQQKTVPKQAEESESDDSDEEFFEKPSVSNGKEKADKKLAELALITDSKKETDSENNTKKKKNKKDKSKDLDQFVGNPNDPRFAAMYSSSLFNMIPSSNKKAENKFAGKSGKKRKFKPSKNQGFHKKGKY